MYRAQEIVELDEFYKQRLKAGATAELQQYMAIAGLLLAEGGGPGNLLIRNGVARMNQGPKVISLQDGQLFLGHEYSNNRGCSIEEFNFGGAVVTADSVAPMVKGMLAPSEQCVNVFVNNPLQRILLFWITRSSNPQMTSTLVHVG